jgi:hypothetical protein
MVSELSFHSSLALLLWACGGIVHHGGELMVEETCLFYGGQREREIAIFPLREFLQ